MGNHAVHGGAKGATDTVELYGQNLALNGGPTNAVSPFPAWSHSGR